MPSKATEAYHRNVPDSGFDSQRDAYEQGYEDALEEVRLKAQPFKLKPDMVLVKIEDL
jgi:hypothetical protein